MSKDDENRPQENLPPARREEEASEQSDECPVINPDFFNLAWLVHDIRAELNALFLQCAVLLRRLPHKTELELHIRKIQALIDLMLTSVSGPVPRRPTEIKAQLWSTLNLIRGAITELTVAHTSEPEAAERCDKMRQSADRMMELLNAASLRPKCEPLLLNQLAQEIHSAYEEECRQKNIRIILCLAPNLCQIMAVRAEIVAVLRNLSKNAIEAMPDGGELTIETLNASDVPLVFTENKCPPATRPGAVLALSDTGVGMSEHLQRLIFREGVTTKGEGRGQGLYLIEQMVRRNNGHIQVGSSPGRGTRFQLLFCSEQVS